jgi:hypothetical protein
MSDSERDLKRREEAKRDANWDPAARWQAIQATLAWAEQQATVRRNTPEACLAEQRRKLAMTGGSRS